VTADGLGRVLRAAGREPAMAAQERAEQQLVGANQELKQLGHVRIRWFGGAGEIENLPWAASSDITLQFLFRAFRPVFTKINKKQYLR
jgi:hypothetical protein